MLNKWDIRHMAMAFHAAEWSKDPSTKVGARIVDAFSRVVSEGFNGPPRGTSDLHSGDREKKLRRTLHAESNAIDFAERNLIGCTIYVTHHPCSQCAARVAQNGIKKVVYAINRDFEDRWRVDVSEAREIFHESGVLIVPIDRFEIFRV